MRRSSNFLLDLLMVEMRGVEDRNTVAMKGIRAIMSEFVSELFQQYQRHVVGFRWQIDHIKLLKTAVTLLLNPSIEWFLGRDSKFYCKDFHYNCGDRLLLFKRTSTQSNSVGWRFYFGPQQQILIVKLRRKEDDDDNKPIGNKKEGSPFEGNKGDQLQEDSVFCRDEGELDV